MIRAEVGKITNVGGVKVHPEINKREREKKELMNFKKPVNVPFSNLKLPLNTDITDALI